MHPVQLLRKKTMYWQASAKTPGSVTRLLNLPGSEVTLTETTRKRLITQRVHRVLQGAAQRRRNLLHFCGFSGRFSHSSKFRNREKGVLAKGVSGGSSVPPKEKKYPRILGPAVHLAPGAPQPKNPLLKTPFLGS